MATTNFLNNAQFLADLIAWRESGEKKVPDIIARKIMLLCQRLADKPNFSGYTWKEDFVGDAIEHCIRYAHNFDPEKSKNPFAYFTQIASNAFIRRIKIEKKNVATNQALIHNYGIVDAALFGDADADDTINAIISNAQNTHASYNADYYTPPKETTKAPKPDLLAAFEEEVNE